MRRGLLVLGAAIFIPTVFATDIDSAMPVREDATPLTADSLPQMWTIEPQAQMQVPDGVADRWWQQFDDAGLNDVISLTVARNYSLAAALRRAEAARQAIGQARAGWYPTIGVSAGFSRARTAVSMGSHDVIENASRWSAGLTASWEIDIFGRVAAGVRQKKEQYRASRAEFAGVMVSLAAQGGSSYIILREMQEQLEVARRHADSQRKIVDMAIARFDAGLASKLDVAQAWQTYYQTAAQIPALENSAAQALSAIATLTATAPADLPAAIRDTTPLPDCNMLVNSGYPAELLRRRPDIIEAEATAAASAAAVGIAKKEFLPTLTLEGTVGTAARKIDDLFTRDSFNWSIAPTLSWTLFDGMARRYAVAEARETARAAVDSYNETVTEAVGEVNNALTAYDAAMRQLTILQQLDAQCREALSLAVERYRDSLAPMSDVVTAQLNALSAETSIVEAKATALQALISLYEALGGNPYEI